MLSPLAAKASSGRDDSTWNTERSTLARSSTISPVASSSSAYASFYQRCHHTTYQCKLERRLRDPNIGAVHACDRTPVAIPSAIPSRIFQIRWQSLHARVGLLTSLLHPSEFLRSFFVRQWQLSPLALPKATVSSDAVGHAREYLHTSEEAGKHRPRTCGRLEDAMRSKQFVIDNERKREIAFEGVHVDNMPC